MPWRSFLIRKLRILVALLTIAVGSLPLLGWVGGGFFWQLDLLNNFQVQYFQSLLFLIAILFCIKSRRAAILGILLLLVPLCRMVPCYISPKASKTQGRPVRMAIFNVFVFNHRFQDTLNWVDNVLPDFIYFTETTNEWVDALKSLRQKYPYSVEEGTGFAFYSRVPILSYRIVRCSEIRFPLLITRLKTSHGEVTVLAVHPLPPLSYPWAQALDDTMSEIASELRKISGPVIVAGDFNATRWSKKFAPLQEAHLQDASDGKDPGGTWMRSNPLMAIPIDRILHRGEGMHCHRFELGPELGSDHRPLMAEFGW